MNFSEKDFKLWKKQALSKLDKSSIGSIDEKIQNLCDVINSREDMFTLSSCSGRICLVKDVSKEESIWKFVSHSEVTLNEIKPVLDNYKGSEVLFFSQEAAIIHICVNSLDLARELMHMGKEARFNQVGIIAFKTKIVVELICDAQFSFPVFDSHQLVSPHYIAYAIQGANKNLQKSWKAIRQLEGKLR